MKRILLTIALGLAVSSSFAQKKAVNQAQSLSKGDKADFTEARSLIQGALQNPETKDDAKTWYVAGFIEDQQFSLERTKQVLGQQPDEAVMYSALFNVLPFFEKAMEIDQQPDQKGRVKPKFTKDIKSILAANHVYYFNGGAYFFDSDNYKKAYDFFEQFIQIAHMPMFQGEKQAEKDTLFMTAQFYAAVAAIQIGDAQLTIKALDRAKDYDYRANDVYQYLYYEYSQLQDTVNMEKTLHEGMAKFPDEKYYILNLINNYIYSGKNEQALEYLKTAIEREPNSAQLHDVMGRVYEIGQKDFTSAAACFEKALAIDPDYVDALSNLGRIYYNQGVTMQSDANTISDNKRYQEEVAKAKALFEKALPFFEKAHSVKPEEKEYMIALRGIYYNLNMGDKFDEMEAKMNE